MLYLQWNGSDPSLLQQAKQPAVVTTPRGPPATTLRSAVPRVTPTPVPRAPGTTSDNAPSFAHFQAAGSGAGNFEPQRRNPGFRFLTPRPFGSGAINPKLGVPRSSSQT